uniref:ATP synthase F0 subunit 8 n=1 Tax=Cornu aspersum TaxID=6535 RepID=S4SAF4_CORAP|nr:ATP synthase F0 subunit 8 [Cornu aspersum]
MLATTKSSYPFKNCNYFMFFFAIFLLLTCMKPSHAKLMCNTPSLISRSLPVFIFY